MKTAASEKHPLKTLPLITDGSSQALCTASADEITVSFLASLGLACELPLNAIGAYAGALTEIFRTCLLALVAAACGRLNRWLCGQSTGDSLSAACKAALRGLRSSGPRQIRNVCISRHLYGPPHGTRNTLCAFQGIRRSASSCTPQQ
ncbi:hypothetical protein VARIO8X_110101 [Burkholderiales bacterium 8X]|nr:hypothetical protein VARIO8X_110101 [Burkholderiales bacterium 8X]